jgi:transcriptional regulator with XRE-family HTH domain
MLTQHNYLRAFRKRTDLKQSDISFLLNQPDYSSISRCEKGHRNPSIEILLLYHLLFNVPIDSLFERQKDDLNEDLIVRIDLLIKELQQLEPSRKVNGRIAFLASTLTRLIS